MGSILVSVIFLIVGACNGLQAMGARNENAFVGGVAIAIFFIMIGVGLFVSGIKAVMKPKEVDTSKLKKCPFCAEMIKPEAIKCRFCSADLSTEENIKENIPHEKVHLTDHQHVALGNASFDLPIYAENPSFRTAQMPHGAPCFSIRTIESLEKHGYLKNDGKGGYLLTPEGKNGLLNNLKR